MFDLMERIWSIEESTIIYICNSIFFGAFFLTFFFIFLLFRQKNLAELPYKKEFVNKNYVNVLYSNNWHDNEDLPILLILPGNPGQAGFYLEFMNLLVDECQSNFKACIISHVGHSPSLDRIFNVRDQVCLLLYTIKNWSWSY